MDHKLELDCPTCKTKIPTTLQLMLQGAGVACPGCEGVIKIAGESLGTVKAAVNKLDEIKCNALKK